MRGWVGDERVCCEIGCASMERVCQRLTSAPSNWPFSDDTFYVRGKGEGEGVTIGCVRGG